MTVNELFTVYWPVVVVILTGLGWAIWRASSINTKVNSGLAVITTKLDAILIKIGADPVAGSESPLQLNKYGKELSKKLDAPALLSEHLNNIKINDKMNEYQIQEACFDYAQAKWIDKSSPEARDKVEKLAFNEGELIQVLLRVLGIELRNAVFNKLGKDRSGVDKPNPDRQPDK